MIKLIAFASCIAMIVELKCAKRFSFSLRGETRQEDSPQEETKGVGNCLSKVERDVGPLPDDFVVLRNHNVSLVVHDPNVEFISKFSYDNKHWWAWGMMDDFARNVGPYSLGMFLEVGTNIGTVSTQFASRGVPVLTVEANPNNYVRVRASQCFNHFEKPFVAVNRAVTTDDNGPGLFVGGWGGNMGTAHTATSKRPGWVEVPPVTVDSLAYGEGSMAKHDYNGLDLNLPVWGMKLDCEGCEGAAILSAKRLLNDPERHPIIINLEMVPKYMKERGGVGPDILYRELKAAGYTSNCPGYAAETFDAKFMEEHEAKHNQWDCVFQKKRQTS